DEVMLRLKPNSENQQLETKFIYEIID
ncbi:MAG: hypothetical protein H6Q92_1101, partial [Nitrospirae bacterium]|nr:hypothetical protein [Nitrospirota bacterium]